METLIRCKMLRAVYGEEQGCFGGPYVVEFNVDNPIEAQVKIEQLGSRTVTISCASDVLADDLHSILTRIERLLMLFDGRFFSLQELRFVSSDSSTDEQLSVKSLHCVNGRLAYYESGKFCKFGMNKLLDFSSVLSAEVYRKWDLILDELDIVHQTYLYSIFDCKLPIDIVVAFLIELAEALVEIGKTQKGYFSELKTNSREPTLKDCLKAVINQYGKPLFDIEISNHSESFVQTMVHSRVRIMHIKRNQNGEYFNGKESLLYAIKMYLLYRLVIFDLLDIDPNEYHDSLQTCISRLNSWQDVMVNLLSRLEPDQCS